MGDGGGSGTDGIPGRIPCGGGNLAGSATNHERGRLIPQNRSRGGVMEGGGGDSQLPLHRLHNLPQLPSWVLRWF